MHKTLFILLLMLVAGSAVGGSYAYYIWYHSDELLRTQLLQQTGRLLPGWQITVARARFDFQGRIHAHGVRIGVGENDARLLEIDEVVVTIDQGRIADENPRIRRIELQRPRLWLQRNAAGVWSHSQLPPIPPPQGLLPEWTMHRLTVQLRVDSADGEAAFEHRLDDGELKLSAEGRRQYALAFESSSNLAEQVALDGSWHLDARSGELRGQLGRLRVDDRLLELVAEFSPEFQRGIETARQKLAARLAPPTEPTEGATPPALGPLGLLVTTDVDFELQRERPGEPFRHAVRVQVLEGEVSHPPLDFPLTDLRGRGLIDNDRIAFEEISARSGPIGVLIPSVRVERRGDLRPIRVEVQVTDLPLDDRVVALLPPTPRKLYLDTRPTGRVGVQATAETDGESPWQVEWTLRPQDCTARHVEFPYLIESVTGTVTQRDGVIRAELSGMAGRQPVRMAGETIDPGPEAESNYELQVDNLPIDSRLREAAPAPLRKVLDTLQIQGTVGGRVWLRRPRGLRQPTVPVVDVNVRNASLLPKMFPLALSRCSARVQGSGKKWKFTAGRGWHDRTGFTTHGDYQPDENGVPRLTMRFTAQDLRFDRSLYEALTDELRSVWYEINPEGQAQVEGLVDWSPADGGRPRVELDAEVKEASLALRSFPYPMRNITARVAYREGEVRIQQFEGHHDQTRLRTEAVGTINEAGEWRFRCEPLFVDDLDAGVTFRRALPGTLRSVVDAFDLRGNVSLAGMIELRGVRGDDYPVTAAWNLNTVYAGNSVTAGLELQEMHGKSQFTGTWDGEAVRAGGRITLDSVKVLGYQLTDVDGPILIDNRQLILGSRAVLERGNATEIPDGERLTASFLGGVLAVDSLVRMGEPLRYDVRVGLRNGLLERYNQLYLSGAGRLSGVLNGVLFLTGTGTDFRQLKGNGRLVIEPADLYDLPLLLAIFRVMSLQTAEVAAFDRAQFDFNVRNGLVNFDRMNLQGESISLFGRGTVRINDRRIKLDFYSASGRRQIPIPILREVTNELTKGWVGVHVEGTLRDPRPEVRPVPVLDDALKKLLGVFDNRPPLR